MSCNLPSLGMVAILQVEVDLVSLSHWALWSHQLQKQLFWLH